MSPAADSSGWRTRVSCFPRSSGGRDARAPARGDRPRPTVSLRNSRRSSSPERHYEQLIGLVADALPARARRERLREIGIAFGRELAREARLRPAKSFRTALGRVCAALGSLGYQASVAEVTGERAVIRTATCPLRPLVRARPRLAELDRGMWTALLARAFAGTGVDQIGCDTPNCERDDADCRVLLSLRARRGQP